MTYAAQDQSQRSAQKVFLYRFTFGSTVYRYTNAEADVTFGGQTWLSETISHSEVSRTMEEDAETISIEVPMTNIIPQQFVGPPPASGVATRITSFHRTDGALEERLEWEGVIRESAVDADLMATMIGKTFVADFSKQIPLDLFQGPCNNLLFDSQCKVNELSFTHALVVASISGLEYTITGLSAAGGADASYFVGGFIQAEDGQDHRMIVSQSGDVATLAYPFSTLVVAAGSTVNVKAGCDYTLATCDSKFSNAENYGGCPYIPTKNLFTSGAK